MEKFEFNYFQPKIQLFVTILTQFYVNFHQNFNRNWWFAFEKCSNIFITNRSANGKIIINGSVNETVANNCLHKLSRSVGMLTENHDKRNRDAVRLLSLRIIADYRTFEAGDWLSNAVHSPLFNAKFQSIHWQMAKIASLIDSFEHFHKLSDFCEAFTCFNAKFVQTPVSP